jgi:transposase
MLTPEAIARAYYQGITALLRLFEQHRTECSLLPRPLPTPLEKTIEGLSQQLDASDKRIERLQEELRQQRYLNSQLSRRISELEGQLSAPVKDSHNSSRPPSSDAVTQKRTKSLRHPSGRKVGGQPGHAGHTLRMTGSPSTVISHSPDSCQHCHASLTAGDMVKVERRQVIDLPEIKLQITEHRAEVRRCPKCGGRTKAQFPVDVRARVRYGPKLRARAVYLLQYQLLPYERSCELLKDWFGYRPSAATLERSVKECSNNLIRAEAQIKGAIKRARVIHVDETGLRVGGRGQYAHVASTERLTSYSQNEHRGRVAIEQIAILPKYRGTCVHDGWASYYQWGQMKHSLCCAHLLREMTYLSEASQQHKQWAEPMKRLLLEVKEAVEQKRAGGGKRLPVEQEKEYARRYDELCEQGWQTNAGVQARAGPEAMNQVERQGRNLLYRLRLRREEVLRFMREFQVPFDNNQAERDLRMIKLQQKVSGCFRTGPGARNFCRIRSYLSTMRKRGEPLLERIEQALAGHPISLSY